MHFTDIFIRRPILALVVSLLILLVGASAISSLPVRQYPQMENATITVSTTFPGATQEVMQGFVTTPIAQSISTANCAKMSCSHSMEKSMSASCDVKAQIAKLEMQAAKC